MSDRLALFLLLAIIVGIAFSIGSEHGGKKMLKKVAAFKPTVIKGFRKEGENDNQ